MLLRRSILSGFLIITIISLHAQILPFEKYTSKNGLISDRITAIAQDENGFMWFGSFFGLCRYNGIQFEKIELPQQQQNKYVQSIKAVDNKVYVTSMFGGGMSEYNNGKFNYYSIHGDDSISRNELNILKAENDGTLYVANMLNQLYSFRNGVFKFIRQISIPDNTHIISLDKDKYRNIWVGTEDGLFIIPSNGHASLKYFSGENIFHIYKDDYNNMWVAARTVGHTHIIKSNGYFKDALSNLKILNLPAVKVIEPEGNSKNGFWYVDEAKGLFNLDKDGKSVYYKTALDLNSDIRSVFTDRENNIWIANEPGVLKITDISIQSYYFKELALAGGFICSETDSSVLVSNSRSIYHIVNNNMNKIAGLQLPQADLYGVLHFDKKKSLWIGFWNNGLCKASFLNEKISYPKFFMKYNNMVLKTSSLLENRNGNILIGGFNGLFVLRNNRIINHYRPLNSAGGLISITSMAIDEDRQIIWLGDNNSGLTRLHYTIQKDSSYQFVLDGYISGKEGLNDTYIRSLFLDHNKNLWVGTRYGGIFKINESSTNRWNVVMCNTDANLTCTRVTDIAPEDSTAVWFATCDGLYRYSLTNNKWQHYNTSNGLLNNEIYSLAVDSKNKIVWALSAQGITKFPTVPKLNSVPPLVTITSVSVLGTKIPDSLQKKGWVHLSYTQNSIGFNFASASFLDEKKVTYKYFLEGYSSKWSEPISSNSINYASLPAGKYVFKVMASNAIGVWSSPSGFSFEITMPFYKSVWFISLSLFVVLFILYMIRFQRLKHQYKIEKIRLNIARDLHDDIGSALGSINLLSKTASRKLEKDLTPQEMSPIFQRIGQSAEGTLEAMDDIVWAINPDKDKIEDIIVRMREFAIPILEARNIDFDFNSSGDHYQAIPMHLRRTTFLIFKEAINNILKHSKATKVRIEINTHSYFVELKINDNGIGFQKDRPTSRNGIKNMERRATSVNGILTIQSGDGGTTIIFKAPIR